MEEDVLINRRPGGFHLGAIGLSVVRLLGFVVNFQGNLAFRRVFRALLFYSQFVSRVCVFSCGHY